MLEVTAPLKLHNLWYVLQICINQVALYCNTVSRLLLSLQSSCENAYDPSQVHAYAINGLLT